MQDIETLVSSAYKYFARSAKRVNEFKAEAEEVGTDGKKLLRSVPTRWISLYAPAQRVFREYPTLVSVMDIDAP